MQELYQIWLLTAVFRIIAKRLRLNKLTVMDATNTHREQRAKLITLAKDNFCLTAAIILDENQKIDENEKLCNTYTIDLLDDIRIVRKKLHNIKKDETGPFDIIGDVHGCFDELKQLIKNLGYLFTSKNDGHFHISHPDNRKIIFVGDLVDRGNRSMEVLRLAMDIINTGQGYCVCGNHDDKFLRYLEGMRMPITHGLDTTIQELESTSQPFREEIMQFLRSLHSHYYGEHK